MRRALLVVCLAAAAHAEEPAFLKTVVEREVYFVHEPIRVRLRIGFDQRYFETRVVRLFQQDLDVQMKVAAPWLDELTGTVRLTGDPATSMGRRLSLALNDDVVAARRVEEGHPYTVLEIEKTVAATQPGELVIPGPTLRFAYGTEFKEDLFHERVATDRRDATVLGEPVTLEIRALPEDGRPRGFTGAVGRFTAKANATPRELDAGAILELTLRIEGEGNVELFDAPRLDLAGFHVYGMIDDKKSPLRTITYDVAPLDGTVKEIPAIPFAFFDPRAAAYRVARTDPIPLVVRGGEPSPPEEKEKESSWLPLLAVAAALLAVLTWAATRKRAEPAVDPAAMFRARVDSDPAGAFTEYLAARLDCPAASVISQDLRERLLAAGVPRELATRTASLLEDLVAARYGGEGVDSPAVQDLVSALEEAR